MYGDTEWSRDTSRPLSFAPSAQERALERKASYSKGHLSPQPSSPTESSLSRSLANDRSHANGSPIEQARRKSSLSNSPTVSSPPTPDLSRSPSTDTANQQFPLNDIDYESSPAAVAQELSNLQAIRRMSMNVDAADPDLPSFSSGAIMPTVAPSHSSDENDTSRLFWVPARLHPELAPKDYKTFVEDRVDRIKRRAGDDDDSSSLSPNSLSRSGSRSSLGRNSSVNRRRSMLSKTVETPGDFTDGADVLERKRSSGHGGHARTTSAETSLQELENLVNDPSSLMRKMSIDTHRTSMESPQETPTREDAPMLPATPAGPTLKRSTRTTYRRGSLRKGERLPPSRRATERDKELAEEQVDSDTPNVPPLPSLSRVQTEPMLPPIRKSSTDKLRQGSWTQDRPARHQPAPSEDPTQEPFDDNKPQPRPFHSRIARHGRTTAHLPGYNAPTPVPEITETPPPESRLSMASMNQNFPERRSSQSSHDFARTNSMPLSSRAASRPAFGKQKSNNDRTLDDMANHPSPMPGTSTSTDSLSFIPTFAEEKKDKPDKKSKDRKDKDSGDSKKTSWGWLRGGDDKDKEERQREKENRKEREKDEKDASKKAKSKLGVKSSDRGHESTRLDVLNTTTDGGKGRESLVLDRDSVRLEEERKKERTRNRSADGNDNSKKDKESSGIFSSLFGGGKKNKSADRDSGERSSKKHRSDVLRAFSPEPQRRVLRPDIDYNWTRFSILEERAIYRMAHIKLANPRRALYSQVLLSNFMYSYLAKVQQMHPQIQIPQFAQQQQKGGQNGGANGNGSGQSQMSDEYSQWQRYQEVCH